MVGIKRKSVSYRSPVRMIPTRIPGCFWSAGAVCEGIEESPAIIDMAGDIFLYIYKYRNIEIYFSIFIDS